MPANPTPRQIKLRDRRWRQLVRSRKLTTRKRRKQERRYLAHLIGIGPDALTQMHRRARFSDTEQYCASVRRLNESFDEVEMSLKELNDAMTFLLVPCEPEVE